MVDLGEGNTTSKILPNEVGKRRIVIVILVREDFYFYISAHSVFTLLFVYHPKILKEACVELLPYNIT